MGLWVWTRILLVISRLRVYSMALHLVLYLLIHLQRIRPFELQFLSFWNRYPFIKTMGFPRLDNPNVATGTTKQCVRIKYEKHIVTLISKSILSSFLFILSALQELTKNSLTRNTFFCIKYYEFWLNQYLLLNPKQCGCDLIKYLYINSYLCISLIIFWYLILSVQKWFFRLCFLLLKMALNSEFL